MDILEPWNVILEVEEMPKKFVSIATHVLKYCGGIAWPILYFWMLYLSWNLFTDLGRMGFIFGGAILTCVIFLYVWAWKCFYKKKAKDFDDTVRTKANRLLELIQKNNQGLLTYGEYTKDVIELEISLNSFRKKLPKII